MENNQNKPDTTSKIQDSTSTNLLKWETPTLKILPVPSRTQGGAFVKNDQDNAYYKKS